MPWRVRSCCLASRLSSRSLAVRLPRLARPDLLPCIATVVTLAHRARPNLLPRVATVVTLTHRARPNLLPRVATVVTLARRAPPASSRLEVFWYAPADAGGAPLIGFLVRTEPSTGLHAAPIATAAALPSDEGDDEGGGGRDAARVVHSLRLPGLANGVAYAAQVCARTVVACGERSFGGAFGRRPPSAARSVDGRNLF